MSKEEVIEDMKGRGHLFSLLKIWIGLFLIAAVVYKNKKRRYQAKDIGVYSHRKEEKR